MFVRLFHHKFFQPHRFPQNDCRNPGFPYLNTNDAYTVGLMAEQGDEKAKLIQNAMAYQAAKEIGAMSTVLKGQVDAILLTGGIAHNTVVVDYIKTMVAHISRVVVYPGEDEMKALAENALRVMLGEEICKVY